MSSRHEAAAPAAATDWSSEYMGSQRDPGPHEITSPPYKPQPSGALREARWLLGAVEQSRSADPVHRADWRKRRDAFLAAAPAEALDEQRLLFAWFDAIVEKPGDDHHHAGCLPPDGDCPVAIELAEFVPRVAAAYNLLAAPAEGER